MGEYILMKYIVAVKYQDIKQTYSEDLDYETEIFEFNSKENRSKFINEIKHLAKDIALSQIEETE